MKNYTIKSTAFILGAALVLSGCGSSSSTPTEKPDLPDGKTLIFFDHMSSAQYMYDASSEKATDMNIDGKNYNMTGKNGKLVGWTHGEEDKIIMLNDDFDIENFVNTDNTNVTSDDFHYLGHLHNDSFEAHSSSEFKNAEGEELAALGSLSDHLREQEEIRTEIEGVLPIGEQLCNFFVLGEEEHGDNEEGHAHDAPHIALTKSGEVYIYKDGEDGLVSAQPSFALSGVDSCEEDKSSIVGYDEHGVLIFVAQTQTLYLVDSHDGADFHPHSSWKLSEFLPENFKPTQLAGLGEADEHEH
jgi:hypothetical protein